MKKFLTIILFILGILSLKAQQPQALLQLDTNRIRMGEQIKATLSVFYSNAGKKANIKWPIIADSLSEGKVLVADRSKIDTLAMSNDDPNAMMQRRNIIVTAFDSAMITLGPFAFVVNGDSVFSNTVDFECNTFEVDTTKAFKDIKGVVDVPFGLWDWIIEYKYWLIGAVLFIAAVAVTIGLIRRRKALILPGEIIPIDTRTADEIALQALDQMRREQRWTRVTPKIYYSELTDVIRTYIEKRFEILALEQTTSELMASLRFSDCEPEERNRLNELLSTADLVKFARFTPDENSALQAIDMGIRFVENTKNRKQIAEEGHEQESK